ncbi:MAG: PD-(D/E)XK nuclease family protein [Patescibacteria group bacterium]
MPTDKPLTISASSLSLYNECKRCFWLQLKQKRRRPSGPFPQITNGIDRVMKAYFDRYRGKGLPPELSGTFEGQLFPDQEKLDNWRAWQRGLAYYDKEKHAQFVSALDDLLLDNEGRHVPFDFKTKGAQVKEGAEEYNRLQLSCYALLLEENHLPSAGYGILMFVWPREVQDKLIIPFDQEMRRVETDPVAAKKLFYEAVDFLNGPAPAHVESCAFCAWNLME